MLAIMEISRLFLASKGNKTESMRPMLWAIFLSMPIILGYAWFIRLQTYVMRLEIILASVGLAFVYMFLDFVGSRPRQNFDMHLKSRNCTHDN